MAKQNFGNLTLFERGARAPERSSLKKPSNHSWLPQSWRAAILTICMCIDLSLSLSRSPSLSLSVLICIIYSYIMFSRF